MSTTPWPPFLSSRKRRPPKSKYPGSKMLFEGRRLPVSSAASARYGLIVDPGGERPENACVWGGRPLRVGSAASAGYGLMVDPGGKRPEIAGLLSGLSMEPLSSAQYCG